MGEEQGSAEDSSFNSLTVKAHTLHSVQDRKLLLEYESDLQVSFQCTRENENEDCTLLLHGSLDFWLDFASDLYRKFGTSRTDEILHSVKLIEGHVLSGKKE